MDALRPIAMHPSRGRSAVGGKASPQWQRHKGAAEAIKVISHLVVIKAPLAAAASNSQTRRTTSATTDAWDMSYG